jgi:hypothetical protein
METTPHYGPTMLVVPPTPQAHCHELETIRQRLLPLATAVGGTALELGEQVRTDLKTGAVTYHYRFLVYDGNRLLASGWWLANSLQEAEQTLEAELRTLDDLREVTQAHEQNPCCVGAAQLESFFHLVAHAA